MYQICDKGKYVNALSRETYFVYRIVPIKMCVLYHSLYAYARLSLIVNNLRHILADSVFTKDSFALPMEMQNEKMGTTHLSFFGCGRFNGFL